MKTIGLILTLCFIFCVSNLRAQNQPSNKAKKNNNQTGRSPCGGGVLNSKAISLPKPVTPQNAKNTEALGSVVIQVKIDEEGNVIETRACSGHSLLRESAVEAAQQAKFKPTFLIGTPVKVSGVIIYNFVPETSNDEVIVLSCPPSMNIIKTLNGHAINLVKPEYPQELKERRLSGAVYVQVTIDEEGKLISAAAVSGHPELRKYAMEAVKKSTFRRFVKCGKPTKLTSGIVYNFDPSK